MNMSGNYSGYYQPFGPPMQSMQPFEPPNQSYRQPRYSPHLQREFDPIFPPNLPRPPHQFAEYNLWGDSYQFDLRHSNFNQAPPRPPFPPRMPDEPPRPVYHSQRLEEQPRASFLLHIEKYARSPFPRRDDDQSRPQYNFQRPEEQCRFSYPPQRPEEQCGPSYQSQRPEDQSRPAYSPQRLEEQCRSSYPPQRPEEQHRPSYAPQRPEDRSRLSYSPQRPEEQSRPSFLQPEEQCRPSYQPHRMEEHPGSPFLSPRAEVSPRPLISPGLLPLGPGIPPELNIASPKTPSRPKILQPAEIPVEAQEEEKLGMKPEPSEPKEPAQVIIAKAALYGDPENFQFDEEMDFNEQADAEQASNSSGSSTGDWTTGNFKRAGAAGAERRSGLATRGRCSNVMQRKLVRALSQPVQLGKGLSLLQRMGWTGGGLGKDGSGIVDPITPNAIYASTTAGFGLPEAPRARDAGPSRYRPPSKRATKEIFKTNLLLYLRQFVQNDLMIEIYFEAKLSRAERKRIHRVVAALQGTDDSGIQLYQQQKIVNDILSLNKYKLTTESEGDGASRKICVFKEAPEHMYLVTPDDCRPCITDINEVEDEPNPFLRSIARHLKEPAEPAQPPPYLFDKLLEFFIDFSQDDYTEFRCLGAFNKREMTVMQHFFTLIRALSRRVEPPYRVPSELLDVFRTEYRYYVELDPNGFTSIKKVRVSQPEDAGDEEQDDKQTSETQTQVVVLPPTTSTSESNEPMPCSSASADC